jgi:hypothetical protein
VILVPPRDDAVVGVVVDGKLTLVAVDLAGEKIVAICLITPERVDHAVIA